MQENRNHKKRIALELPEGYEVISYEAEENSSLYTVLADSYEDDEGDLCHLYRAEIILIELDAAQQPVPELFVGLCMKGKVLPLWESPDSAFLSEPCPISYLGKTIPYYETKFLIRLSDTVFLHCRSLNDWRDDEHNLSRYAHILTVLASLSIDGKRLPALDLTPEMLLNATAPSFEGDTPDGDEPQYVLALDEGTTSARAILFDKQANVVSVAQHEITGIYPKPGWVEQDPMEIYANQYAAMTECIAKSGISPEKIAAVGITNQRETVILWDKKTGTPIYNAIGWQCRRTADLCRALEEAELGDYIRKTTGLRIDPYFSGTKIAWILDNVEGARERALAGELLAGTVDTWLIWKLTGGRVFVTDRTNASRTMLCNIHTGEWDATLLELFGIPEGMLPEIRSSSEIFGSFECMGAELAIAGIAGDQQSALFGQTCFDAGEAKNTYGTGCFLLAHTGKTPVMSRHGLLTTIVAGEKGRPIEYALEGSVFVGGAGIRWLRDEMKLIHEASDSEYFARKVKDSDGVYFVPAFTGLGAPHWDMHARGTVVGLTAGTGKNHIIRAALEAIAYESEDVIAAMNADIAAIGDEIALRPISILKVDGGASANDLLMQMQSDLSAVTVRRSANPEATALGAAFLAGLGVGFYRDRGELRACVSEGKSFSPEMPPELRAARLRGWHRAVAACRAFAAEEE